MSVAGFSISEDGDLVRSRNFPDSISNSFTVCCEYLLTTGMCTLHFKYNINTHVYMVLKIVS